MNRNRIPGPKKTGCLPMIVLALCCWVLCGTGLAAEQVDFIETFEHGQINWSTGLLTSSGVAAPPEKSEAKNAEELEKALEQARSLAVQNMLDLVLKTRVDSLTSVGDIATQSDIMMAKVRSLMKGVKPTKQEYLSDGTVEVTMQMNMHGGFAQLVLPGEIKQIESIKTVSSEKNAPDDTPQESSSDTAAEAFTGLVVDARGIRFSPAMAPVIVDEKAREVYGSAFASREFAVQQGMSGYARKIEAISRHPRVAGKPLAVKGLGTVDNRPSTIIISNADASKIKRASEHLSFLKKCRVMIVVD